MRKFPILRVPKSTVNTAPKVSLKEEKSRLTIPDGMTEYIPASGEGT